MAGQSPQDARASDLVWTKHLLIGAGIGLLVATVTGFVAQTATLAGSFDAVSDPATLKAALLDMNFGISSLVRLTAALLAITAAVFLGPGRRLWVLCAGLGVIACASFAWMGHGAATEGGPGWVHLAGDIAHLLAAAGWIGALVVFWIMLARPVPSVTGQKALCASLAGFSGVGTMLVAIIVASGLINSFFLVGWDPAAISSRPAMDRCLLPNFCYSRSCWRSRQRTASGTPVPSTGAPQRSQRRWQRIASCAEALQQKPSRRLACSPW